MGVIAWDYTPPIVYIAELFTASCVLLTLYMYVLATWQPITFAIAVHGYMHVHIYYTYSYKVYRI